MPSPKVTLTCWKTIAYTVVIIHFGLVGELYCSSVDDTTDPPPKFATSFVLIKAPKDGDIRGDILCQHNIVMFLQMM
jgi:hypothetical protein